MGCGPQPDSVHAVEAKPVTPAAPVPDSATKGGIRGTGLIKAVNVFSVQVPQIAGQGGRITLVKLVPNGSQVKEGQTIAQFDDTKQQDDALEAEAKMDDLGHQIRQRMAQNKSDAEQRLANIKQAEADLAKAQIQLKKGPVLSVIERQQNEARAEGAKARFDSLTKSHAARVRGEAAALRILELQRERQQVALERAKSNARKMEIKARITGMIALENIWKGGTMGNPQEGDQLWNGQPLLKIFDPSQMEVQVQFGEPDGAVLKAGARAEVRLDAYPEVSFPAEFSSASPVATAAIGSPIKNFGARFRLLAVDPRLLPDLSAVVVIQPPQQQEAAAR